MDLNSQYQLIIHEILPNIIIVADNFHLVQFFSGFIEGIIHKIK